MTYVPSDVGDNGQPGPVPEPLPELPAAKTGDYVPAVGSDPHKHFADQQAMYAGKVADLTPWQPGQEFMSNTDGGVSVGGQPGEPGTL